MHLPLLLLAALAAAPSSPRTFRVDYFHTGTATEERFSLDRLVLEPLPWPGHSARAIDDTNLGKFLFEVRDRATQRLLYSRGFSSIYAEWETTDEAKRVARTFHESLRFPAPSAPVLVVLKKRDAQGDFHEVWSLPVDPRDMTVDVSRPADPGPLLALQKSGPPEDKVDLLLLGDGYTAAERGKFEQDARRLMEVLFRYSPFKERRSDFNVWGLVPPSEESGVSRPSTGIHRRSRVGATYDAFGAERYVLTFENRSMRDVASFAPYEHVEILVNGQTYGGGGIFGLYSTVAAGSEWAPYLFVHEFGHHFAALADEYYTSESVYGPATDRVEPWERNVTALKDPAQLKWKELLTPGAPLPTPWGKAQFETRAADIQKRRKAIRAARRPESEMDALFLEQKRAETAQFGKEKHAHAVGAFEGAMYEPRGYYRPQADCVMFSRNDVPFCAV
ncbi:MAG: IgA Peptidase M64, partial [Myxococcaceae bacterium]|nr:IgA Peptidase M64 [Myxococcaceae bacterium]